MKHIEIQTGKETPMSLYGRVDRELSPRPGETLEYRLLFVVCFALLLISAAFRRPGHWIIGGKTGTPRSILSEARANAANCAAASFMGM
jgi:hypothetical protein